MLTMLRAARPLASLLSLATLSSACAFHNINLIQDTRISLSSPSEGKMVTLPVTVTWKQNSSIGRVGETVSYAVFVDRTVIKPGETLRAVVPDTDTHCLGDPKCPDTEYLNNHDVYVTNTASVTIPRMPRPSSTSKRETHRILVIIMVNGKRQGEGAFALTLYTRNQT